MADAQSLSFGGRHAEGKPGGRDEVVPGHLHGAVQPAAQALRAPVQRALQGLGGGRLGQRVSKDGVRVRHLNPARAKLLGAEESLKVFAWSSYPDYLKASAKRPRWLRVNRLLGEHRIAKDSAAGRAQFEAQMEQRRAAEDGRAYQAIRRGRCFGEKAFRKELLEQIADGWGSIT